MMNFEDFSNDDLWLSCPVRNDVKAVLTFRGQGAHLSSSPAEFTVKQLRQFVLLESILGFKLISASVTFVFAGLNFFFGLMPPFHMLSKTLFMKEVQATLSTLDQFTASHINLDDLPTQKIS